MTTRILLSSTASAAVLLFASWAIAAQREVPDDKITPGVAATTDAKIICGKVSGLTYSQQNRHTSPALKNEIRARDCPGQRGRTVEIDHRCELSIGCADVKENLWCQPGPGPGVVWNYHDKDGYEDWLYHQVCTYGTMVPAQAQSHLIAPADWRKGYCTDYKPSDPRCKGI